MLLIVITTIGSLALAAHGWPGDGARRLDGARHDARVRWLERDQPLVRPRHRRAHAAHERAPGRQRPRRARRRARPSALVLAAAGVRCCSPLAGALARGRLGRGRLRLLRARLHRLAQAPDAAEHRHRRRCRRRAAARRLGRSRRLGDRDGRRAVRDRLPLDAAPLLVARPPARRGLRARRRADAADRARRAGERAADPALHAAARRQPRSCPVALGTLSWIYAIAAALLGARFVWLALRLLRTPGDRATARRTFLYSLLYLALLFAAMGIDSALLELAVGQAARRSSTVTMSEASSRIETGVTAVSSPNSGSRLE